MARGITWTHIQSVWNHSGPSKVPYSSNQYLVRNFFFCFLQKTGSSWLLWQENVICRTTKTSLRSNNYAKSNWFFHFNSLKPKVPVTEAPPRFSCNPNQFACHENGSCIPKTWVCDDEPDCEDESGKLLTYYALLSMKKSIHNSYNNFVPFQMN